VDLQLREMTTYFKWWFLRLSDGVIRTIAAYRWNVGIFLSRSELIKHCVIGYREIEI